MLIVMFVLLFFIYGSAYYMNLSGMKGEGTDGLVNDMASRTTQQEHHPFIELPGDSEVSAFSVANLFAGLIIGYNWRKLSEKAEQKD
ncbi:hypothetical protein [Lucifera butyrica]|nr:hypothetical protein [Lucifera butyrica]